MIGFYLFWCLGYLALHLWLAQKWPRNHFFQPSQYRDRLITLVIPFRNESRNIPKLASEIAKIASDHLEVLLVDDQSEDDSWQLASAHFRELVGVRLVKSLGVGKKAALSHGISLAQGEIILTSDADCEFPEAWPMKMASAFSDPNVQLVAGPVLAKATKGGFLQKFQQIEWYSILLMTQFYFFRKQPLMCSGTNLAFRKQAFLEVGGYDGNEHILSGDDEFLLKKIVKNFGANSCIYQPVREALVYTTPQLSWTDLLRQRIRWSGKWKAHRSISHGFAAVLTFLVQLIWVASMIFLAWDWDGLFFFGAIWLLKAFAEHLSLGRVGEGLGSKASLADYFATSLIHPFYVIWVGLGTFFIKVKWKGRSQEESVI